MMPRHHHGVVAGDNRGASSWSGGEKTRNVDKVSGKTLVAIYSRTASKLRTNFVTVVSEVWDMATTRSQAARDAAAEITTERESSTSVASDVQTYNMMAFLQQIVSHQIEEGVREKTKRKNKRKENERKKRETKNDLKKTVREYIRTDSASGNVTI